MMLAITFQIYHPKFIFQYRATVTLNKVEYALAQYICIKETQCSRLKAVNFLM